MPPLNTITGDDTANVLEGTAGDDAIYGLGAADTLRGLDGDDWLDGGAGNDTMAGGTGDDTYAVDASGDSITELAGEGTDTVRAMVSWVLGANLENLVLLGNAAINGTGNTLDNVITGNAASNILNGGAGNDTLDGGLGADTLVGGTGNDTFIVETVGDTIIENTAEGRDTVRSSLSWVLSDNLENLTLTGSDAIDGIGNSQGNVMIGNDAENTLNGLDGNDTLDGGLGADTLIGGLGSDVMIVDDLADRTIENANEGTDTVRASLSWTLDSNIENLVLTGSAAIDGTGNALDNTITGNAAINILLGLDGNDTLDGRGGGDRLEGGSGDDTYVLAGADDTIVEKAGEGIDTVQAGFSYTLGANLENLTLTGTDAIDATGNDGDNVITGNSAANVMTGKSGDDTYVVDAIGDRTIETAGGGTDTVRASLDWTLAAEVENLVLTGTAAINGNGNALGNRLDGNDANNTLDGAGGADVLAGHKGNDTYVVDNAADQVVEIANEGRDQVLASVSFVLGADVENLTLTGTGAINATGNGVANVLRGNAAANVLDGGAGSDDMDGGDGSDIYLVSAIRDHIGNEIHDSGTTGTDELRVAAQSPGTVSLGAFETGIDRIVIGTGTAAQADTSGTVAVNISASRSAIGLTLIGNAGANQITGSKFSDVIDGGAGADRMAGGLGDDVFYVDNSADYVREGTNGGNDTVYASASYVLRTSVETLVLTGSAAIDGTGNGLANTLVGNDAANRLDGGKGDDFVDARGGDDTVIGGAGNDDLRAGAGNDVLSGGLGNDKLSGGSGADMFRYDFTLRSNSGFDTITDFSTAEGDKIQFTLAQFKALGATGALAEDQFWAASGADFAHDATDRIIYNTSNGQIYYDADGSGTRYAALLVAVVGTDFHPFLSASDFMVI
ncbi:calcium-binding protein [Novosphingobium huizhouense]|uniref:calcium-binding protein n=1 Tax=Novosphingobium huizhouense TaxID=2866625 RepID=UPI001CD842D4|nr:calcium-binding protein [Novosphingobium huizhouense]